ncbi:MAG: tetratricopeptide repeat protein [Lentisphaerota bacterium]
MRVINLTIPGLCCAAGMLLFAAGCASVKEQYLDGARRGNPEYQAAAGAMYINGGPAEINYDEACNWAKAGSAGGSFVAMYYLAEIYANGYGNVTPDHLRAARYYDNVAEDIKKKAAEGHIGAAYVLGRMCRYGQGLPQDKAAAMKCFRLSSSALYAPALNQLGEMTMESSPEEAKRLFFSAAEKNCPEAQYNLADIYFNEKNQAAGIKWLKKAAENQYPPAQYRLAGIFESGDGAAKNPEAAQELCLKAARSGYAPAQYKMALLSGKNDEAAAGWMKKAAERSYVPAMNNLAETLLKGVDDGSVKALILYELARKSGDAASLEKIIELDNKTGLYLFVKFSWNDISNGENYILANSPVFRIIDGYKAGITAGSKSAFQDELAKSASAFYLDNAWYHIYSNKLPFAWAGDIFRMALDTEKGKPGFWFCYGSCIGMAGHGEGVMYAVQMMGETANAAGSPEDKALLLDLATLMKANALILMNNDAEAYNFLFTSGKLKNCKSSFVINYVNLWAPALLKDRNKFAVATGIDPAALKEFRMPEKQLFYDAQLGKDTAGETLVEEPVVEKRAKQKQ